METYKFETTIQKDGTIRIPEMSRMANRPVELFIVMKQPVMEKDTSACSVDRFLVKWTGVLEGLDVDSLKQGYLREKYA